MNAHAVAATFVILSACMPADRPPDRRALALEGDWRLELRSGSGGPVAPETGRIALVAVRHDAKGLPGQSPLLAAGAISMDAEARERLVSDGSRVTVHGMGGDSVSLRFASARGEYYVILSGALHGDSLAGRWQSVLARSSGAGGRFLMWRLH